MLDLSEINNQSTFKNWKAHQAKRYNKWAHKDRLERYAVFLLVFSALTFIGIIAGA
jgi:membrane protein YqaA with SNARE-associated domain